MLKTGTEAIQGFSQMQMIGRHSARGEAIVTRSGIEGGAVYALAAELREAVLRDGQATLNIALRADLDTLPTAVEGPEVQTSQP